MFVCCLICGTLFAFLTLFISNSFIYICELHPHVIIQYSGRAAQIVGQGHWPHPIICATPQALENDSKGVYIANVPFYIYFTCVMTLQNSNLRTVFSVVVDGSHSVLK